MLIDTIPHSSQAACGAEYVEVRHRQPQLCEHQGMTCSRGGAHGPASMENKNSPKRGIITARSRGVTYLSLAFTSGEKSWIQDLAEPVEAHSDSRLCYSTQGCCCSAGAAALVVEEAIPCNSDCSLQ